MSDRSAVLLARQDDFLRFLRRRTGNDQVARDVLQSAWLKALEKQATIRDDESTIAWFYRLLRNAAVDVQRRAAREARALERESTAPQEPEGPSTQICNCVPGVIDQLEPGYARLLRRVDLEGARVPDVARQAGITPNNAAVRLHRARRALRRGLEELCGDCAQRSCLDCDCA